MLIKHNCAARISIYNTSGSVVKNSVFWNLGAGETVVILGWQGILLGWIRSREFIFAESTAQAEVRCARW
jgi:hypothetical protein